MAKGRPKQRTAFSAEEIATYAPRLKPQYAKVFLLAADLNISLGTVKSRLNRARAQIARFIEEDADANAGNA